MTTKTPQQIFGAVYKGSTNFMTPNIENMGFTKGGLVYEVSSGRGINDIKIYGVTIIKIENDSYIKMGDLNKCLDSMDEVNEYINQL